MASNIFTSRVTAYILILVSYGLIISPGWGLPTLGFIILFVLFFLVYNEFYKFNKIGKIIFYFFILLAIPGKIKDLIKRMSDESVLKIETGGSWNEKTALKSINYSVYNEIHNYPGLKKLKVIIIDECVDLKGNIRKDSSIILLNDNEINEYRTYKDEYHFGENCVGWALKVASKWKRCK